MTDFSLTYSIRISHHSHISMRLIAKMAHSLPILICKKKYCNCEYTFEDQPQVIAIILRKRSNFISKPRYILHYENKILYTKYIPTLKLYTITKAKYASIYYHWTILSWWIVYIRIKYLTKQQINENHYLTFYLHS